MDRIKNAPQSIALPEIFQAQNTGMARNHPRIRATHFRSFPQMLSSNVISHLINTTPNFGNDRGLAIFRTDNIVICGHS